VIAWSSKLGSVGRDIFFFKSTSMLLPLKSHKLVCFFLTTAYSNLGGSPKPMACRIVHGRIK
jgi:hypothetical protein